ncbi:Retrovirus-related Pol polyprotein from transposon gypsy [Dictyocoela muelleri]|nr:Retrovirus-related Pol polyprotein from transposon gypsy [Dictyocoela muelleri]
MLNLLRIYYEDIVDFISKCENCMRERVPHVNNSITLIVPSYQRERIIIDTIDMSIYSSHNDNYNYIFTFIDSFSKFAWAYSSKRRNSLCFFKNLKKNIYIKKVFRIFFINNGGEFINTSVKQILNEFGIRSVHGRPYHSQSQGQIERFNITLKERLRKCLPINHFDWINYLDKVVYEYNNLTHSATKLKQFVLFEGYDNACRSINNNENLDVEIRLRYSDYVNKYRREYEIRQRDVIDIGSKVMLVKPYNLTYVRRQHLESIYYDDLFEVLSLNRKNCQIKNERRNEIINTHMRCLKNTNLKKFIFK